MVEVLFDDGTKAEAGLGEPVCRPGFYEAYASVPLKFTGGSNRNKEILGIFLKGFLASFSSIRLAQERTDAQCTPPPTYIDDGKTKTICRSWYLDDNRNRSLEIFSVEGYDEMGNGTHQPSARIVLNGTTSSWDSAYRLGDFPPTLLKKQDGSVYMLQKDMVQGLHLWLTKFDANGTLTTGHVFTGSPPVAD